MAASPLPSTPRGGRGGDVDGGLVEFKPLTSGIGDPSPPAELRGTLFRTWLLQLEMSPLRKLSTSDAWKDIKINFTGVLIVTKSVEMVLYTRYNYIDSYFFIQAEIKIKSKSGKAKAKGSLDSLEKKIAVNLIILMMKTV